MAKKISQFHDILLHNSLLIFFSDFCGFFTNFPRFFLYNSIVIHRLGDLLEFAHFFQCHWLVTERASGTVWEPTINRDGAQREPQKNPQVQPHPPLALVCWYLLVSARAKTKNKKTVEYQRSLLFGCFGLFCNFKI